VNVRKVLSYILGFIGGLTAVLGMVLLVAQHSVYDRATVATTTDTIVSDPDVTRLLSREITNRLVKLGDLEAQRPLVEAGVTQELSDPAVQRDVSAGVLDAYEQLRSGSQDAIAFNMPKQAARVRSYAVTIAPQLDSVLPPADELLKFELFQRQELPGIYHFVDGARKLAVLIFAFGVLCLVVALAVGPGRFGVFAWEALVVTVATFLVATLVSNGTSSGIDHIQDRLTRRVARLATDGYLNVLNDVALGVVIFGIVAFIAGLGGSWIRSTVFPPKPKVRK
jgi:hypothetical protein